MVDPPQFNKMWLQLNLKEAWEPTFTSGYLLGPQLISAMGDMHLSITQAEHDAAVAAAIPAATGTNAPAGDLAHATDATAITTMRGGQPAVTVVPPISTASGAVVVKLVAKAKNTKPPADPLNVMVVNPDNDES